MSAAVEASVKGAVVRGIATCVRARGILERVCARLDAPRAALLREPPLPGAWVTVRDLDALCVAISAELGPSNMRDFHRAAIRVGTLPMFEAFIKGLLRLFGATPHAIFSRLPEIHLRSAQGHTLTYERTGERSCTLRSMYEGAWGPSDALLESTRAAADHVFSLCAVAGTVSEGTREPGPGRVVFAWEVRW